MSGWISVRSEPDLGPLTKLVSRLVGERCWDAYVANGEELQLDIGAKREYVIRSGAQRYEGSWVFSTPSLNWTVDGTSAVVSFREKPHFDEDALDWMIEALKDTIRYVAVDKSLTLRITFENGHELIVPAEGDEGDECWGLSTPDKLHVEARPGSLWRLVPAVGGD